ncbi:MAG: methyl-accepting chemotaxis protein [Bacteroidota bacterium]|nr:methyl-accepting chemotaxis protein [Bacteroidota bacterium]
MTVQFQKDITNKAKEELNKLARINLEQIAKDVYSICESAKDILEKKISYLMIIGEETAGRLGAPNEGSGNISWLAVNQVTKEQKSIALPQFFLGKTQFKPVKEFSEKTPLIDEMKRLTNGACTLFQRMNDAGDMLRIATNVPTVDGKRAISTFIPAVNPDKSFNPIISKVLKGQTYSGIAYGVNAWYITSYKPLRNSSGKIIGMLSVGEKLSDIEAIRRIIIGIRVGKTGYVYVLGGKGDDRGHYVISKNGERDGQNIWDSKDADGRFFIQNIVNNGVELAKGEVKFESYQWQNPGEEKSREKIAGYTYFAPWDWVICPSMYIDDYHETQIELDNLVEKLMWNLLIIGMLSLIFVFALSLIISGRITKPVIMITDLAKKIASGNIYEAKNDISERGEQFTRRHAESSSKDETGELFEAFTSMTANLDALIGQVHRSGIQVTTSATQISASSRELESTVAEQAASTKEVSATSKEISATSAHLVQTMNTVNNTLNDTAETAETGKGTLNQMENVMQDLIKSTNSITFKLSVINEKANKISSVVTTINKISDQTNLLSLNAAIEAEKAGEYGKGFSVVSREISRLADQTAIATQDIEQMVSEMQSSVSSGVMEMDKFSVEVAKGVERVNSIGEQLNYIIDKVRNLAPQFESVTDGMKAQTIGAEQISESMVQLSAAAEQTKESLLEFKSASSQLSEAVQGLKDEVSRFKISI